MLNLEILNLEVLSIGVVFLFTFLMVILDNKKSILSLIPFGISLGFLFFHFSVLFGLMIFVIYSGLALVLSLFEGGFNE